MSDLPDEFRKETIKRLHENNADMQQSLRVLIEGTKDPKKREWAQKELRKWQRGAKRLPKA